MGRCINIVFNNLYLMNMGSATTKSIITGMVIIIIGLSLTGTVWDQVYGSDGVLATSGVNGTTETFLKLIPMLWVILVIVVGALVSRYG